MSEPVATTLVGQLQGTLEDGIAVFRGIPYSAPPVGDLRWRPPEPVSPWFGIRSAKRYGAHAPQPRSPLINLEPDHLRVGASEDCLTLNVYTPGVDDATRPVMVWIHGGGFTVGSSSQTLYDGGPLARRGDVVVVTINYRLGALGFMRLVDITGGRIPSTGNEGLLDQIAALSWVRNNIAEFGGDPENVTAFGESAGAMGLAALLSAPQATGLFQRAIVQSGSTHMTNTIDEANRVTERVLEVAGLTADPEVLKAADAELISDAVGNLNPRELRAEGIGWIPLRSVIDGELIRELPIDGDRSGTADGIPVISGTTADEWRFMAVTNRSVMKMDHDGLLRRLERILPGELVSQAVELYRQKVGMESRKPSPADLYSAILTDLAFRVPCERMLDAVAQRGAPAYRYLFTWSSPAVGGQLGACHAVDLGFTFGTNEVNGGEQFFGAGIEAARVVDHIQEAWLAFAKGDDPNFAGHPEWRSFDSNDRATMEIGLDPGMKDDPWRDLRELWSYVSDEVLRRF